MCSKHDAKLAILWQWTRQANRPRMPGPVFVHWTKLQGLADGASHAAHQIILKSDTGSAGL